MWGEWSPLKKLIWLHIVLGGGGGGTSATVTGASPLALVNALAKPIKKLIQYGKCTTVNSETYCNNGKLVAVDDELPAEYKRQIGFKFSASTYYRIPDFHLRGTDTVRISFSADKACNVFGCYTDTSADDNYSLYASTSSGGKYLRYDGDTYSSYIPSSQVGERLDVVITPTGTTGMPTDSVITPVEFESVADLCIGTTSSSASSSKLDGNIWGNFIVDGQLTLIPCERLSDNVLGYYDPDSDTFYEPIGSAPTSLGVDSSHLTALSVDGTAEVLTRTGKNLINYTNEDLPKTVSGVSFSRTDGDYIVTATAEKTGYPFAKIGELDGLKAGTYTLSYSQGVSGITLRIIDRTITPVQTIASASSSNSFVNTFTLPEDSVHTLNVEIAVTAASLAVETYTIRPMLEVGSTASAYEPYSSQTATVANLFAVDDIADEQNIISGTITRRCEAVISDGTTPSGRYIGEVGEGNIIVKVRETGYEGDIATFEATEAKPLNGLSVNVEPIQDLHGYDSPWPAGGGANMIEKITADMFGGTVSADGLTITSDTKTSEERSNFMRVAFSNPFNVLTDEIYYVSFDVRLLAGTMTSFGVQLVGGTSWTAVTSGVYGQAPTSSWKRVYGKLTVKRDDSCLGLYIQAIQPTAAQLEVTNIQVAKTEDYNYHSYSNICPISGRTSATVTRTGRNLFDINTIRTTVHGMTVTIDGQTVKVDGTSSASCRATLAEFQFPKAGTYHLHTSGDLLWLKAWNSLGADATVTVDDISVVYRLATATLTSGTEYHLTATENQIEIGSSFSAYEPYAGTTYTIILGDTVYGGSLDVTQGKMVVDRAMVDLGTLTWSRGGTNTAGIYRFSSNIPTVIAESGSAIPRMLCSQYATVSPNKTYQRVNGVSNNLNIGQVMVFDDAYSNGDVAAFKTAMSGVQLCYELATPFEIPLTPTQISTLLGTNNVWSDAGSVKAYVADGDLTEHVTRQPMRTAEGSNTVSVTSAVDPVQLEVEYVKAED